MPDIMSTVLILTLVALAVFFAARKLWKDKKAGKTCCGGGNCPVCAKRNREKKFM